MESSNANTNNKNLKLAMISAYSSLKASEKSVKYKKKESQTVIETRVRYIDSRMAFISGLLLLYNILHTVFYGALLHFAIDPFTTVSYHPRMVLSIFKKIP